MSLVTETQNTRDNVLANGERMVDQARRLRDERREAEGRPARPERGPFAEMALSVGVSPEVVRRAVAIIGGTTTEADGGTHVAAVDFGELIGPESRERFLRESAAAFARRGLTT